MVSRSPSFPSPISTRFAENALGGQVLAGADPPTGDRPRHEGSSWPRQSANGKERDGCSSLQVEPRADFFISFATSTFRQNYR